MTDNAGKFYILNGNLKPSDTIDRVNMPDKGVVYEVIRIIDRVPLFFEAHYNRMVKSMEALGHDLKVSMEDMGKQIGEIVRANQLINCNVKVVAFSVNHEQNHMLYISKSYYPSKEEYERGVPVSLMQWERNDPNVKVVNRIYKEKVAEKLSSGEYFEVLLVNNQGFITEGSRSNVFFIKGSKIITAPGELVLKGITRQYIIEVCRDLGYEVEEELVSVKQLDQIDGLFISGTSIKVLPVSRIDDKHYQSSTNKVITTVMDGFDRFIRQYISECK